MAKSTSNTDLSLRRLIPGDARLYRDIRLESLLDSPEAYGSAHDTEAAHNLDWFAERLTTSNVVGGFLGDALAGIAGFGTQSGVKNQHKGYLWGAYVRPEARGQGVGRRLCEEILSLGHGRVEQIQLTVTSDNVAARRLYESLGFAAWGIEPRARRIDGRYVDDVHMVRHLN
ncbi:GNAT family N-acetyltransferase [Bauldia sp.]|uniref:GNAT family N-acetyltransferase n=1 Tax=Bauldia sp. TaxID=2575872 RepID=UPI003BA9AD2A